MSGNIWKSPTESIRRMSYQHRDTVEPNKYINNVEEFKRRLIIKKLAGNLRNIYKTSKLV